MGIATIFVLCSFVVGVAQSEVTLEADMPHLTALLSSDAELECCYRNEGKSQRVIWHKIYRVDKRSVGPLPVNSTDMVTMSNRTRSDTLCGILTFKSVQLNDSGLYFCFLSESDIKTHGTYLRVYKPLETAFDLSESTKNRILTAEGILLLLCVLLPSATLLCKSRKLNELERKKSKKEEENIYQGLNLDDCCSTYDQIERSQGHGPYQDVCNIIEEEEEMELEKP